MDKFRQSLRYNVSWEQKSSPVVPLLLLAIVEVYVNKSISFLLPLLLIYDESREEVGTPHFCLYLTFVMWSQKFI